ncbi:MAG TPA: CheB methylesterase domain-containing protein [Candidatus Polarisedimenticolia bacterium]|nr:CheB methylesterase domain-containing protein [Candidatus Polarisedimenticolia bacterium]
MTVSDPQDLIVIGCSTGGPPALQEILPELPRETTAAVVVAQHMPQRFTSLFAGRLHRLCALPVSEPKEGDRLAAGRIYIAAGGQQTTLDRKGRGILFSVRPREASERYAPSADLLMTSAAGLFGARILAVLMSGMGGDGVAGLRAVKESRGRTIVESEESAAVFGMPRGAIRAGLADRVLPRRDIALEMVRVCRRP